MERYIISYSGGLGSFMAAWLTVEAHGPAACTLLFTDTKTEDPDLYRFLKETTKALQCKLVHLSDGRDIWGVFRDVKFMGNSRIDPCSKHLKREIARRWVDKNARDACIVFGIGHQEAHRIAAIRERWAPYRVEAPLIKCIYTKDQIEDHLDRLKIKPPKLYELGFPHNNCGGFCVKTGQAQMALLLRKMPDRYRWHEQQQEKLFKIIGKRRGFIRRTVDGELQYLGLKEFREIIESGAQPDLFPENGCGCFI